jgi:6-phospho-3-hexuloisomerase
VPNEDKLRLAGLDIVRRIAAVMEGVDWASFTDLAHMLPRARHTFVTGAGRSGLIARGFGMRLMHAGLSAYVPGETITPATGEGDILVAISCTGTTGFTEYIADRARRYGATVVVITATPDSPLAKAADKVIVVPAEDEDIVLRAAVFEHASGLCLDAVFNVLSERLKLDQETYRKRHANLE